MKFKSRLFLIFFLLFSLEVLYAQSIIRGPYLQLQTTSSINIKWRTDASTDSKVWYGTNPLNLNMVATEGGSRTDHEIKISGLPANTTYYYAVGNAAGQIAGGDNNHFFSTMPLPGSTPVIEAWVLGDAGKKNDNQRSVRDGFYTWNGGPHTDMILLLGDNAYADGTDAEYQLAWFENMYESSLINSVMWASIGNHDMSANAVPTENAPYFDIFTIPKNGEAGGVPSGTAAYYSYDYGNAHFVVLDSWGSDRSPGSPMAQWLQADLAANNKQWVIAYWHHPIYSSGSINSDMRGNFLPILEAGGADLVMVGHKHSYIRSFFINGQYGSLGSFDPAIHGIDMGDGKVDGDGSYTKTNTGPNAGKGTVYVVSGSAGGSGTPDLSDGTTYTGSGTRGSSHIRIAGNTLEFKFINYTGAVEDYFTIQKPNGNPPTVTLTYPGDGGYYTTPQPITITADATDTDGNITQVEFFIDGNSIGVDNLAPYEMNWTIPANGNYTITATAVDNDNNVGGTTPALIYVGDPIACARIDASANDAEEADFSGFVSVGSGDLELVTENSVQTIGLRFTGLNIPPGVTISSAYIQFAADETNSIDPCNLNIYGIASNSPLPFSSDPFDITDRPRTVNSVTWSPPLWTSTGDAGPGQETIDLKVVIEELINRPGYTVNSAIGIVIDGTGKRVAESFDGNPLLAPQLCIEFEPPYDCPNLLGNIGDPCSDGDPCTTGETISANCGCVGGTYADSDGDTVCDGNDVCPGFNDTADADADGVPNGCDICPGHNDTVDSDGDGTPDGCDVCPGYNDTVDSDGDGTPDGCDACPNGNDTLDGDNDGVPDGCDICPGSNDAVDTDGDGVPDGCDLCPGSNDTVDSDGDGIPNGCDACPSGPNPGMPCNDNNVCTTNDMVQPDCSCAGTFQDSDGDGTCDAFDQCNGPEPGSPCNDGNPNTSGEVVQSDCTCSANVVLTVCSRVETGSDDAEEKSTGNVSTTSSDLELINDGSDQIVGMRFNNLGIPAGSLINNAFIQFATDETVAIDPCNLNIYGQASSNALTFTTTANNLSIRPPTAANKAWTPGQWSIVGEAGNGQKTPDISSIVQEIVNVGGFTENSSIVIFINGTGKRVAESWNGNALAAPQLCVEFVTTTTNYDCPTVPANYGEACNDGDPCTVNDMIQNDCNCAGTFMDSDSDGTCDANDVCPGGLEPGTSCGPSGAIIQPDCSCSNVTTYSTCARVNASSDDGEEKIGGNISLTSSDLELTEDGVAQRVGMRFNNLNIPPGAIITNARIQFGVDENTNVSPCNLNIYGEANGNAPTFSNVNGNIVNRTLTNASVPWSPADWLTKGQAGPSQLTPNFANVIQEIISQNGYSINSSIVILITGSGRRTAESFDGSIALAPELCIEYNLDGANYDCPGLGKNIGDTCNDGDPCTTGDTVDGNCNCAGTFQDADSDGTCDANDVCPGGPEPGTSCGPSGEIILPDCNCGVVTSQTVCVSVNSSTDDAEERSDGSISIGSSDLELVEERGLNHRRVGMRFNNLGIPQGANIISATLQFGVDESKNTNPANLTVLGEASDNAATFQSVAQSISLRPVTNNSIAWSPQDWNTVGVAGADQLTPDISAIIQEIVSRPGFTASSSIALFIEGTGKRVAEAYDGSPALAPKLCIEYGTGGANLVMKDFGDENPATLQAESIPIQVAPGAGLETNTLQSIAGLTAVKIFPNPARNYITLAFTSNEEKNAEIRILDLNGRLLRNSTQSVAKGDNAILMENLDLPSGIYFLQIATVDSSQFLKFVINR